MRPACDVAAPAGGRPRSARLGPGPSRVQQGDGHSRCDPEDRRVTRARRGRTSDREGLRGGDGTGPVRAARSGRTNGPSGGRHPPARTAARMACAWRCAPGRRAAAAGRPGGRGSRSPAGRRACASSAAGPRSWGASRGRACRCGRPPRGGPGWRTARRTWTTPRTGAVVVAGHATGVLGAVRLHVQRDEQVGAGLVGEGGPLGQGRALVPAAGEVDGGAGGGQPALDPGGQVEDQVGLGGLPG